MQQLLLIIHVLVGALIIALVMMQQGKGAGMGAGFGSGASGTVFGSQGHVPFLFKLTALFGAVFFATSLGMAIMVAHQAGSKPSILNVAPKKTTSQFPLSLNQGKSQKGS